MDEAYLACPEVETLSPEEKEQLRPVIVRNPNYLLEVRRDGFAPRSRPHTRPLPNLGLEPLFPSPRPTRYAFDGVLYLYPK